MKAKLFILMIAISLNANINEKDLNLPNDTYKINVGKSNQLKVTSNEDLEDLELPKTKQEPRVQGKRYSDEAYIFYQMETFNKVQNVPNLANKNENGLLTAPSYLKTELAKNQSLQQTAANNIKKERTTELLLLRCYTDIDWKVNLKSTLSFFCNELNKKDKTVYKLRANLEVLKNGASMSMKSSPYMLENDKGQVFTIEKEKSRIFNALSGDENLATYVDKRAIDGALKGMAKTLSDETPELAKDYLDKKNQGNSTISQTENSVIMSENNNPPEVSDYGITLLISTLAAGASAFVDQLYLDLGYIYFIPKGSVIEAELFIYKD